MARAADLHPGRPGGGRRPGPGRAGRAGPPSRSAERAALLLDLHDAMLDRRDELADLLQAEGGKARLSAVEEVLHVALTARYYGRTAAPLPAHRARRRAWSRC